MIPVAGDYMHFAHEGKVSTYECLRREIDHGTETVVTLHVRDVKHNEVEEMESLALDFQEIIARSGKESVHAAWECVRTMFDRYWIQRKG